MCFYDNIPLLLKRFRWTEHLTRFLSNLAHPENIFQNKNYFKNLIFIIIFLVFALESLPLCLSEENSMNHGKILQFYFVVCVFCCGFSCSFQTASINIIFDTVCFH